MSEQKQEQDRDEKRWKTQLSRPSEKGVEVDDNEIVKSEDKMPDGASNLFEDWGSELAEDGASTVSSWRRGR